jgi:hypothetical protein
MEKAGKGEIVEQEGHEKKETPSSTKGNGWSVRGRTWSDMASTGNEVGKAFANSGRDDSLARYSKGKLELFK